MFHRIRGLHRWIGIVLFPFLLLIAATGFLLATKSSCGFVRPPEKDGETVAGLHEVVSVHSAAEAAFALGIPELRSHADIDRIDYRPESNVFKIVSDRGYHEVQVDGKSGKVLQVAKRVDQFTEDLHDLSYISKTISKYGLPLIAIALFSLTIAGIIIFGVPIVRRARFRKANRK